MLTLYGPRLLDSKKDIHKFTNTSLCHLTLDSGAFVDHLGISLQIPTWLSNSYC